MKFRNSLLVAGLLLITSPGLAPGQDGSAGSSGGVAIAYPDAGFSWLNHASTSDEGFLRGASMVIESAGRGNYYHSLAAVNYQEAYRRAIDNSVSRAEAYYKRKEMRQEYQERYGRKAIDMETAQKLAAARTPDRLSQEHYDAEVGIVQWPYPLDAAIFSAHREQISELLVSRNENLAGWGSRNYEMVRREVETMKDLLETVRNSLDTNRYVHALRFLESIQWEARFAPDTEVLTSLQN